MKLTVEIDIPDTLTKQWLREAGASDNTDLLMYADETITDAIAAAVVGINSGDRYESVRDQVIVIMTEAEGVER